MPRLMATARQQAQPNLVGSGKARGTGVMGPSKSAGSSAHEPTSLPGRAQSLPATLIAHIMQFLPDYQSLCRLHAVCRNWNLLGEERLDAMWRPLLMRQ